LFSLTLSVLSLGSLSTFFIGGTLGDSFEKVVWAFILIYFNCCTLVVLFGVKNYLETPCWRFVFDPEDLWWFLWSLVAILGVPQAFHLTLKQLITYTNQHTRLSRITFSSTHLSATFTYTNHLSRLSRTAITFTNPLALSVVCFVTFVGSKAIATVPSGDTGDSFRASGVCVEEGSWETCCESVRGD